MLNRLRSVQQDCINQFKISSILKHNSKKYHSFLKSNLPTKVAPGLYIGGWRTAVNRMGLKRLGIQYIIGVTLKAQKFYEDVI